MIAKKIEFTRTLMVAEKKEPLVREGKKTMYFMGFIGMGIPKIEMMMDEDFYNMLEEGMEFDGTFQLEENIKDANYGKFNWSFIPKLLKVKIK